MPTLSRQKYISVQVYHVTKYRFTFQLYVLDNSKVWINIDQIRWTLTLFFNTVKLVFFEHEYFFVVKVLTIFVLFCFIKVGFQVTIITCTIPSEFGVQFY